MKVNYKPYGTGPSSRREWTSDVALGKASNPEPAEQSEFPNTKLTERVAEILPQLKEACDTQNWNSAAQLLGQLAELTRVIPVGVLPMEILVNIVDQMQALLGMPDANAKAALALALRLELQSAAKMETQDPSPVLAAIAHVLGHRELLLRLVQSDPEIAAALAAALGPFSECVGKLPPDEGTMATIGEIIPWLAGLFDGAIGQHPANVILAPEVFHVLCTFAAQRYPNPGLPGLILGCLGQILQQPDPGPFATPTLISLVQSDDEQVTKQTTSALAAILKHFSECIPHLPEENCNNLIDQMQQLFVPMPVLSTKEEVALEALHIVVLLAIKTKSATLAYLAYNLAYNTIQDLLSVLQETGLLYENRLIAGTILRDFSGIPSISPTSMRCYIFHNSLVLK